MEEKKFYTISENGEDLQTLTSLSDAALEWELNQSGRTVHEVRPDHKADSPTTSFTHVREVPVEELRDSIKALKL